MLLLCDLLYDGGNISFVSIEYVLIVKGGVSIWAVLRTATHLNMLYFLHEHTFR